jgi:hypothetical protein
MGLTRCFALIGPKKIEKKWKWASARQARTKGSSNLAGFYVPFNYPLRRNLSGQREE